MRHRTLLDFLRNSGIFLLGAVLSRLITFLMLPVYTAVIPVADYGYYDLSITIMNLSCEAIFVNLWVALLRRMYDEDGDHGRILRAGILVFVGSASVYVLLAVVVGFVRAPRHLWLLVALGLVQAVNYVYKHACRGMKRNWDFAVSGILGSITVAGLNLLFLLVFKWGFQSLYVATVLGLLAEVAYLEIRIGVARRIFVGRIFSVETKELAIVLFFSSVPLGLNAVANWFINQANRSVVSYLWGFEENGIFAAAAKFGSLTMLVILALNYAWQDQAFKRGVGDGPFFSRAATAYASAMLGGVSLLISAVDVVFPYVVNERYSNALAIVPFVLLMSAFAGFSNFLINIFYALDRNVETMKALLIAGLINALFVFPLVARWASVGATLSAIVGYFGAIAFMLYRLRALIGLRVDFVYPLGSLVLLAISYTIFAIFDRFASFVWLLTMLVACLVAVWRLFGSKRVQRNSDEC